MEIVTKIAPLALALIMLGVGLSLSINDFLRVIKSPKIFFVGITCQLLLLPLTAFFLIKLLSIPIELALGVMIIAAAPGGVTSNILTKFAKGDVALSISLTAIVSIISIFSVPLIVFLSADLLGITNFSKEISMASISFKMVGVVTIPVIIGMIIRKLANNLVTKNIIFIDKITGLLFIIVFASIWIEERNNILQYITEAGSIVLILNIVMMFLAYNIAKIFASNLEQRKCIAIECGLQNGTLAVFVATQIFNDVVYLIPTAAYALIMYITSFTLIFILNKLSN